MERASKIERGVAGSEPEELKPNPVLTIIII